MAAILTALGAFIIGATVFTTATRYGDLPDRVPIHFGITGTADTFGPRAAIWILVAAQLTVAVTYAFVYTFAASKGALVMGDSVLAILWFAQVQMLSAATSGSNRINIVRFLIFFVIMLAIGVTATRHLG